MPFERLEDYEKRYACARAAHEVNRAYCVALGDTSQVSWDEASEELRKSAQEGVKYVLTVGPYPEGQHRQWCKTKREAGWKYGPVKDAKKKEHPCLVEYGELSLHERHKDYLFISIVSAMAEALGYNIATCKWE